MTLHVIIDNGAPMPDRLRELIGVDSFGKIIFKRRTLSSIVEQATAAAGLEAPIHVTDARDWAQLGERVRRTDHPDDRFLVCPSGVIASRAEVLAGFLQQARYSPQNIMIAPAGGEERDGWRLMTERMFRGYLDALTTQTCDGFFERHRESFVRMDDRLTLIDLSDEVTLLEFLSHVRCAFFQRDRARRIHDHQTVDR